jgi:hypothetical protein
MRRLALFVFMVALLPGLVLATEQTGKIRGKVTDASGITLEGVAIQVQSPAMQGLREVVTGPSGDFWLPGLPPGDYELQVTFSGYATYVKTGLVIQIGANLTVNIEMVLAEVSESVVVIDERPVIDVGSSTQGQIITREHLETLPTGRSYQSAARLTAGVTGGANPSALGGHARENKWLLDGANTTDPVTGTFSFNFNVNSIEEIEVITGAFRAENGGALGAIINVRTRSGSNTFEANARGYVSSANWSPRRDGTFAPDGRGIEGSEFDRDQSRAEVNLSVGGPILRDRIWFFSSIQYQRNVSTRSGVISPRVFPGHDVFTKLTVSPFRNNQFQLTVHNSTANISNRVQSSTMVPDAQNHQHQNSLTIAGQWDWRITNNIAVQAHYTHLKTDIDSTPQPCTWRNDDRFKQCKEGQSEGYIDYYTPGVIGTAGAKWADNYYRYSINDRSRDSLRLTGKWFLPSPIGVHEIKVGVELSWLQQQNLFGYTGNIYYVDRLEDESDPSSSVNYYWRESAGQLFQKNVGSTQFVYLQDTWEIVPGLTIDLGVKYDRKTLRNDVGERIVGFDMVSPVGGIAWDPTGRQVAKLFAGGGMVIDDSPLAIASFLDKNGLGRKLFLGEYFDSSTGGNNSFDQYSYASGQSDYSRFDKLTVPRIYNIVLGFEVQPIARTKFGMTASVKLFRNLWEDDEINYIWNDSGNDTIGVVNGVQDNFFRLRTPNSATRNWFGLTFAVQRAMHKNLLIDINYTYSMTRGLTPSQITAALDNPTQEPLEYGWLYSDRPHVVKAAAAYRLPFGLQLGGQFNFSSGSRFDREYRSAKGFGGYNTFQAEAGTFDSIKPFWSMDVKVSYYLKLPHGKVFLSAELSNVTNNRQTTSISNSSLDIGGEYFANGRQGPMTLELGLGYDF